MYFSKREINIQAIVEVLLMLLYVLVVYGIEEEVFVLSEMMEIALPQFIAYMLALNTILLVSNFTMRIVESIRERRA